MYDVGVWGRKFWAQAISACKERAWSPGLVNLEAALAPGLGFEGPKRMLAAYFISLNDCLAIIWELYNFEICLRYLTL